jgi:hypothetical protein
MSRPAQPPASYNLSSTSDSAPPVPTVPIPLTVRASFALWLVAVAAGLFETVLVVGEMVANGSGSAREITVGVAIRLSVFTAAVVTALYMRRGRNWARTALALGLGVLGTASLVAEPISKLVHGEAVGAALSQANALELVFGVSRALHVSAVLIAVVLMFQPAANAYSRNAHASPLRIT